MTETSLRKKLVSLMQSGTIELTSSHPRLSYPIIERLYKKMSIGLKSFEPIQVHKKLIINGHHRYVASLLAGIELEQIQWIRSPAKKEEAWELVEFYEYDRYSAEEIKYLDELDALELGLTYEELTEKIK